MTDPLAHSGGHTLVDHLVAVAQRAADYSSLIGKNEHSKNWAYLAGLWHDLGKYRPGFQRYVRLADNPDAHIEGKVGGREKTHSAAGALWAIQRLNQPNRPFGNILAYLIAGHHVGLDDWDGGLKERLQGDDCKLELVEALAAEPPANILAHGDLVAQIPGVSAPIEY